MARRRLLVLALVAPLLLAGVACNDNGVDVPGAVEDVPERVEDVLDGQRVAIEDFSYDPERLTVQVGDEVTWSNRDDVPHTATAGDGSFDSGTIDPDGEFTFTFAMEGEFTYHCTVHGEDRMSATVVVESS